MVQANAPVAPQIRPCLAVSLAAEATGPASCCGSGQIYLVIGGVR
jgi:hypothetical protein